MRSFYLTDNVIYYPGLFLLAVVNHIKYIPEVNKKVESKVQFDQATSKIEDHFTDYRVDVDKIYPTSGGISVTDFCQLRCNYCSFSSSNLKNKLSQNDINSFVNYLIKNALLRRLLFPNEQTVRIVITGGGEPTSAWNEFVSAIEYIKKKCLQKNIQCQISATTNGMLSHSQREYLLQNLDSILVSYDGLPEIQNKNRIISNNAESARIVEETLNFFDKKRANYSIRTTIWPEDYHLMNDMAEYICTKYAHAKNWDVEPIIARGRAIENVQDMFVKSEFADAFISAKMYIKNNGYKDILSCSKFNSYTCGTIYGFHPWLVPNGDIVTCQDAKEKAVRIGRVDNGIIQLSDFYDKYAELYDSNIRECQECFAYGFCYGGCPLKRLSQESEKEIANECANIVKYWESVLHQLTITESFLEWKKVKRESTQNYTIYSLERM